MSAGDKGGATTIVRCTICDVPWGDCMHDSRHLYFHAEVQRLQALLDSLAAPAAGGDWAEAAARTLERDAVEREALSRTEPGLRDYHVGRAAGLRQVATTVRHAKDAAGRGVGERVGLRQALSDLLAAADASWEDDKHGGHDWHVTCEAARALLAPTPPARQAVDITEKCFACDRLMAGVRHQARTSDGQTVYVGPDCYRKIERAALGYQPPKGGPVLFAIAPGCDCEQPKEFNGAAAYSNDCPVHGIDRSPADSPARQVAREEARYEASHYLTIIDTQQGGRGIARAESAYDQGVIVASLNANAQPARSSIAAKAAEAVREWRKNYSDDCPRTMDDAIASALAAMGVGTP